MEYKLQPLHFPNGIKIVKNDFTTYDPSISFNKEDNYSYLYEDLMQIECKNEVIDLGWYGDPETNEGEFVIYIIVESDWYNPKFEFRSKSQKEITQMLNNIFKSM